MDFTEAWNNIRAIRGLERLGKLQNPYLG